MIDGINDNERLGGLLLDAIDISGNEFAMGFNDSSCTWHFYYGTRGAGHMINGWPRFESEPGEIIDALEEYLSYRKQSLND